MFRNGGDTIQYHCGLRSRELGQAPMLLVFLTPRQALSSHPRQQMVWLYWLQDRDSMPNWYTINHLTILHTHNETQLWNWIRNIFILKSRNLSCLNRAFCMQDEIDCDLQIIAVSLAMKHSGWSNYNNQYIFLRLRALDVIRVIVEMYL